MRDLFHSTKAFTPEQCQVSHNDIKEHFFSEEHLVKSQKSKCRQGEWNFINTR